MFYRVVNAPEFTRSRQVRHFQLVTLVGNGCPVEIVNIIYQ